MKLTDIQIELVSFSSDRLRAFGRIVIDNSFMVRDIRVLEGNQGLFVAMPSRKVMRPCPKCKEKNHLSANYCNDCGGNLSKPQRESGSPEQRAFADIAHPINAICRDQIEKAVLAAFEHRFYSGVSTGPFYFRFERRLPLIDALLKDRNPAVRPRRRRR